MKNPRHIQQGDVLLRLIPALPSGCTMRPRDQGRVILAHGEATGHWHGSEAPEIDLYDAPDGRRFLVNEALTEQTIHHAEHGIVTLPPKGIAEVGQVIEKDWFTQMVRPVFD